MNRLTKYLLAAAACVAAVGFGACTDDPFEASRPDNDASVTFNPDGTLGVTLRMEVPGMTAATRFGDAPAYDDPNFYLYLLVFEQGEGLAQYERIKPVAHQADEVHGHTELLTFHLSLDPTEKPATLHLIATDQPGFEQQIGFGTEERVIPTLHTRSGAEAYWQRIALDCNIPSREQASESIDGQPSDQYSETAAENAAAIGRALSHVPMIRNFCRVSVDNRTANFRLTGLFVLNTVDRGSVAPYVAGNRSGERFVVYHDEQQGHYVGRSYADISAQGHIGTLPAGVLLTDTDFDPDRIASKSEGNDNGDGSRPLPPVYLYERPARVNSTERTYVILRGHYNDAEKASFYKLDLGYTDESVTGSDGQVVGLFAYYNLLRNFDYAIRLNAVENEGYESFEEAAKGVVFNNFSASVEARNMTGISDGEEMIFVKFADRQRNTEIFSTTFVFTTPDETINLLTQYRTEIDNHQGGEIHNELVRYRFDPAEGDPGVIASIETIAEDTTPEAETDAKTAWNEYRITGGTPTDLLRQQTVYVYRGNRAPAGAAPDYGLYRIINFFSHTPWSFPHINTFTGLWESAEDMPSWDWPDDSYNCEIGQSKGSPLTLFFELPAGLPQALFPLEFVIESDRQNIQNAYQGNAVVRSVPASESLFATDPTLSSGAPTTSRIQYVKTVSWKDYFGEQSEELIGTGSSIVRCRFLTITDLNQDGIGQNGKSTTTLRVQNRYFGQYDNGRWIMYHQDSFLRDTETSDPSPRFWDFNSPYWDQILYDMNSADDRTAAYSRTNNVTDELIFVEESKGSLTNATDAQGIRYVQTSRAGDLLTHQHTYANTQARTLRLEVISTDDAGNPTAPRIEFYGVNGGSMTNPTAPTETLVTDDGRTVYAYEVTISQDVTKFYTDIKAPTGAPQMRFYKIDFYPRWDEYRSN